MSNTSKARENLLANTIWRFAEQFGMQLVQFITQLVMARLLLPSDFGLVAMMTVFITIAQVFVDSGLGQALIQKKEIDNVDLSSVFFMNLCVSLLLYLVLFIFAPVIASYYNESVLINLLRVHGLVIIINSLNVVQTSVMIRQMEFKKSFLRGSIGIIIQGIVGVTLALYGFGVWAITISHIARSISVTVVLWYTVKWKWDSNFSLSRIKELFKYGSGILLTSLTNTIFTNIHTLVIAKKFNSSNLGYYNRGDQLPRLVTNNITMPISAIIFPVMSREQDNLIKLKSIIQKFIIVGTYATFPAMMLLFVLSKPIILLLLTDKWLGAVPYMQFACIKFAFAPMHDANLQALKAIGKSDVFFKLSVIKNTIAIIVLIITVQYGIYVVAIGAVLCSFISLLINIAPIGKHLNYNHLSQFKDVIPAFIISCVSIIVVVLIGIYGTYFVLLIQITSYLIVYLILSKVFRIKGFQITMQLINDMRNLIKKQLLVIGEKIG